MSYGVFMNPIDDNTSPSNIQLMGEVINTDELLEEGGPSKSSCDGLTSVTPPRYADDNAQLLYFESEDVANEFSRMMREDFISEVNRGNLHPRSIPAWSTNPTATSFIHDSRLTALVPRIRKSFPLDLVSDSQLISASEAYLTQNGRVAGTLELLNWIEVNRNWEKVM